MVKLHRNTIQGVISNLDLIFAHGKYADNVVEKSLKNNAKWGSRDRKFVAEATYEIVRWWRLLRYVINEEMQAVDYYKILGAWLILNDYELPPYPEFKDLDISGLKERHLTALTIRKIRESIPDWLDNLGSTQLPDIWDKELKALNKPAKVVLRVNTLKISKPNLIQKFLELNIETTNILNLPDALILEKRINLLNLNPYLEGLFEVQDASSQLVAPFLNIKSNMHVIDACAGAGGKTLHIAALMNNAGSITALDIDNFKLNELHKRSIRAGVKIIKTQIIDSDTINQLDLSADVVLLDAPCSGLGVLKRNPDAKWKLSESFIDEVQSTQQHLLNTYSGMVKKGGTLVYVTCSILPSENNIQIEKFINAKKGAFVLEEEKNAFPSEGFDGFYMARLKRLK